MARHPVEPSCRDCRGETLGIEQNEEKQLRFHGNQTTMTKTEKKKDDDADDFNKNKWGYLSPRNGIIQQKRG